MSRGPRIPRLLHERTFRRFWLGQTVSLVGDQVTLFAIPIVAVLFLHASPAEMGYLTAAGVVPSLLFSLSAGAWSDRRGHRRRTMLVADVARGALLLTIPAAALLGALTLAQLYAVAFLVGVFDVLFYVAYNTLFVSIVKPEDYLQGNSLLNGSRAMSSVVGQSLAGLLVTIFTAPIALLADACSFVFSALCLRSIHPQEPPTSDGGRGQRTTGIRFIARSSIVRSALGATATVNYFNFVFFSLFTLYAVRLLGVRPVTLGLVLSAGAVGALVGSALTGPLSRLIGVGRAFVLSCLLFPAPLLLVPAAPSHGVSRLVFLFLAEFGSGLGVMILDISIGTVFATVIPDTIRASVSGAYRTVNYGMRPLGALTGGALGSLIGVRSTLWFAAIGGVFCVVWVITSPLLRDKDCVRAQAATVTSTSDAE
ncbi:MAG TPA: MFS transporter [Ktedonobacterales bacterium]|nr:MFS transporter [Ktedonobacterales bacterium]